MAIHCYASRPAVMLTFQIRAPKPYNLISEYGSMGAVKTTVEIADSLFAEAKAYAQAHGQSLRELLEEGLRLALERNRRGPKRFRLRDGSFQGGSPSPALPWAEIRQRIYEGRGE